ncbi:MAG: SPFH domain-containing protein [Prevotella sp.]|jgi:regulator of protease activity HflC (stomatin/prohibitin superfamily)
MEKKEYAFNGEVFNGFLMIFVIFVLIVLAVGAFILVLDANVSNAVMITVITLSVIVAICALVMLNGFMLLEPNTARVMMFFGKYRGTFQKTGFFWVNPFYSTKNLSLRARNLDAEPIKVNDKTGNPVMIGQVLVWKLRDTYRACFEVDANDGAMETKASRMAFYENFVKIQGDAALRKVAGEYPYDDADGNASELTLRGGGDDINKELEQELSNRLDMAGIEVIEARINYLAYAPEIAAVMLRRQQASAIITAREKIVEGAVSMVKLALEKLSKEQVVDLDDDKKAAMVSNLMVVLCGDDTAQPVVNTGTLNM